MFEKVRPTTHRGNGSDSLPKAGLSDGRLALVHRYMIDAEEAEGLARDAAEKAEARAREEASAAAAREQARREAAEQARIHTEEIERRRAGTLFARAGTPKPETDASPVEEALQRAPGAVTDVAPRAVEEVASGHGRPDPSEEARSRKALVKADKLAARQAARQMAALEKKEARERKALAKAAARRKTA